jgi:hypothetical protein
MISDAEFLKWLRRDERKVLLVEIGYYDPVDGSTGTFFLSDRGYNTNLSPGVEHRIYTDDVVVVPSTRRTLGTGRASRGELEVDNTAGQYDSWLTRYKFDGRDFRMLYGSPSWEYADFRVVFVGITKDRAARGPNRLVFRFREPEDFLDVPLNTATIAAGPNKGDYQPVAYGACFNVPAVLLDGPTHVYQVSDVAMHAVSFVKDEGKGPVGHTADLAAGTITLASPATGNITVDLVGAQVSGIPLLRAGAIVHHIITTRTALPAEYYDSVAFSALDAEVDWEHNLWAKGSMTARQAIESILESVNAKLSRTPAGQITVIRYGEPADEASEFIGLDDYERNTLQPVRSELPWKRARLGYRRNYFVQESLDTVLTEAERATLSREYMVATATNAVTSMHPLAVEPELIETTLTDQADAEALLALQLEMHSVERFWFELSAYAILFQYAVGVTVNLTSSRYGLSEGKNFLVWDTDSDLTKARVRLTLWC